MCEWGFRGNISDMDNMWIKYSPCTCRSGERQRSLHTGEICFCMEQELKFFIAVSNCYLHWHRVDEMGEKAKRERFQF